MADEQTDKKKVAAAAHTAHQAKLAWKAVDAAELKVERARADVEAAEEAVEQLREQAEAAQGVADAAREAAQGIPNFVDAQAAEIGVER